MQEAIGFPPVTKSGVPLGRAGDETDIGSLILYMASRGGAYLNGNVTIVDGGRLSVFPATY
jgi:NAD(P)-dependent dehydrogenase (short-subunit alcohol dehydrogenase family)